jgi:hypothetical protein
MTLQEFIDTVKIEFSADIANSKPVIDGKTPFKYNILLKHNNKKYSFVYTMGAGNVRRRGSQSAISYYALNKSINCNDTFNLVPIFPKIENVLENIVSDCHMIKMAPLWEDFANEFGYNEDSRKDHAVYQACVSQYMEVRSFFGEFFEEFLSCVD